MNHIEASNKAIDNAGGNQELARKLSIKTGISEKRLYGRIRMWRINGVSLPHIRNVSKIGNVQTIKLIP